MTPEERKTKALLATGEFNANDLNKLNPEVLNNLEVRKPDFESRELNSYEPEDLLNLHLAVVLLSEQLKKTANPDAKIIQSLDVWSYRLQAAYMEARKLHTSFT